MIVDTSAIVAIALSEPEALAFRETVLADFATRMSVVSYVECRSVLEPRGLVTKLEQLLVDLEITLEPVTVEQASAAADAGRRFGKGHHPASLDFGDCFVYALVATTGAPLQFKGNDLARTDLLAAA